MSNYLETLIWTMLFVIIVEMIFPSSDIKKYLKLVLGFIVIYIIINPVILAVTNVGGTGEETFLEYVGYYQDYLGVEHTAIDYEGQIARQSEGMQKIYEQQLAEQVKRVITQNVAAEVNTVTIETVLKNGQYEISEVAIDVTPPAVDASDIGISVGSKNESIVLDPSRLEKQIKNCLNNFYNWDNTNIYITVQEND